MRILFENENLIAVDKPVCVLTTPARDKSDPRICLGRDLQDQLKIQIYPVHRLDFEVSGVVLFAKTAEAHRIAQKWFENQEVSKTYQAIAEKSGGSEEWTEWFSRLVRGKRRSFEAAHGLPSVTRARLVDPKQKLWELHPVTGRPHQLRVEMAKRVGPIAGDVLYGAQPAVQKGIALRAVSLDFSKVADRLSLPERIEAGPLVW